MWPLPPPLTTQKYYPGYATEYHDWHEFRILLIYRQSVVSVEMFKTDGDGVHRAHTRTEEFSSSRRCKRSKKLRNCTRLSFYDISVIIISIIFYYCFFFFFFWQSYRIRITAANADRSECHPAAHVSTTARHITMAGILVRSRLVFVLSRSFLGPVSPPIITGVETFLDDIFSFFFFFYLFLV